MKLWPLPLLLFIISSFSFAKDVVTKKTKGIEFKNLHKPSETSKIKWQKVIVGQESIDAATLIGVDSKSSWRRLGLQSGDVIINLRGKEVHRPRDLNDALSAIGNDKDESVDLKVLRQDKMILINYKLQW